MNQQCISLLPSLAYFNQFILDTFSIWGESEQIETTLIESDQSRRTALKQAITVSMRDNGSNGSFDELLEALNNIPAGEKEVERKTKSIQEVVRKLGRTDFSTQDELTELTPLIRAVIMQKIDQENVSQFAFRLWELLLKHYKHFVRSNVVGETQGAKAFDYFLMQEAPIIGLNLLQSMLKMKQLSTMDNRVVPFFVSDTEQLVWPLRAGLNGLLEVSGRSSYALEKFHKISQNIKTRNLTSEMIWLEAETTSEVCEKAKQLISRMNSETRISWDKVNQLVMPLVTKQSLDLNIEDISLRSYFAYWIHNLLVARQKLMGNLTLDKSELARFYAQINDHYDNDASINPFIELTPIEEQLENRLLEYVNARDSEIQLKLSTNVEALALALQTKKLAYQSCSFFSKRSLGTNFLEFWEIRHNSKLREYCLFILEQEFQLETPVWLHEWIAARINLIHGDFEASLNHFQNAIEDAKYRAGKYFSFLYYELMAFCRTLNKVLLEKKGGEQLQFQLDMVGATAASFARTIGYTAEMVNDPKSHIKKAVNPFKYHNDLERIKEVFVGMKVILNDPQITKFID